MSKGRKLEFEVLKALEEAKGQAEVGELVKSSGLDHSAVMRGILALQRSKLIQTFEMKKSMLRPTDEGKTYGEKGLPEKRLTETAVSLGGVASVDEVANTAGFPPEMMKIALGWAVKKGWCEILKQKERVALRVKKPPGELRDEQLLQLVSEKGEISSENLTDQQIETSKELKSRKLLSEKIFITRIVKLTNAGLEHLRKGEKPEAEVTALTGELLTSGKWRGVKFREYDVTATPPPLYPGKKNFYMEFLEDVRRTFLSLGFEEAEGPYVEMEFWNFDALFQPQDHPAREIHDIYILKRPRKGTIQDETLARRIKQTHEDGWTTGSQGWHYEWSADVARRLILRSHTTAVSVRHLFHHKKPPVKMFCISKVFRPDVLDATHAMEFSMCEGILMDSELTFRHMLGVLSEVAEALELGKVIFRTGYFPFTEPSVESFVEHPKLGWMEWAGAGMFRPEVIKPLGVKHPVLAWGIGIDRLAMAKMGIDDIRELHSRRLDFIRER